MDRNTTTSGRPHTDPPEPASSVDGDIDVDALLAGVYRRHGRHRRRRLVGSGLGVMAVSVLAAVALTAGGNPSSSPDPDAGDAGGTEVVALTPYTVSVASDATPLATVDGLELTYLPPDLPAEPLIETYPTPDHQSIQACFGDTACAGDSLGVAVTRGPDLDLERYRETTYMGGTVTETTVGGLPALATGVESDDASGLVWSPQPGVVISINIDSDMAPHLRRVVDGARFTG